MKLLNLLTVTNAAAAGLAIALGVSLFVSAEAGFPPKDKPTENADGTLSFHGVSDRQLLEFTANQVWLLNRRVSAVEFPILAGVAGTAPLNKNVIDHIQDLSAMVDEAERKAVEAFLPNVPEGSKSLGGYYYRDREMSYRDPRKTDPRDEPVPK